MKTTFPKVKPKIIHYRDYKNFVLRNFRTALKTRLQNRSIDIYAKFEVEFMETLNDHDPLKKKTLRANDNSFMTKALQKVITKRSALQNRYYMDRLPESLRAFKKQRKFKKADFWKRKKGNILRTSTWKITLLVSFPTPRNLYFLIAKDHKKYFNRKGQTNFRWWKYCKYFQ